MSNKKRTRRILRTRRLLHEALVSLILEKGYADITVQDILDRANVGRSTFYAHFRDKEDLLLSGFDRLVEEFQMEYPQIADRPARPGASHGRIHPGRLPARSISPPIVQSDGWKTGWEYYFRECSEVPVSGCETYRQHPCPSPATSGPDRPAGQLSRQQFPGRAGLVVRLWRAFLPRNESMRSSPSWWPLGLGPCSTPLRNRSSS